MPEIKVVLFDIKEKEYNFFEKNKPEGFDFVYIKEDLPYSIDKHFDTIKDAEIVSVFTPSRILNEQLAQLKKLKLIVTRSTGYNNIDAEYCAKMGIAVANVPKYGDCTVAEFAFALILNVLRNVNIAYNDLKFGASEAVVREKYIGGDLIGKTLGIIGTGAIGGHAAKIAFGFGMKVLAYDPFPKEELKSKYEVNYTDIETLYSDSDIITLHAPATNENFHMLNDKAFETMKKGVIIVNTARGEIIDSEALYRALKSGKVAGAGLDVLECEEIISNQERFLSNIECIDKECLSKTILNRKFLDMPNVIVTPHIGYDTKEAVNRILQTSLENIKSYKNLSSGGNLINKVN